MIQKLKDGTILINGFEKGISDDPYKGLADMRNVNIISIPGEASVNFATSKNSAPPLAGTLTTTSDASNTITLTGGSLEVGQAIFFTGLSNTGACLANSTPYWIKTAPGGGVYTVSASFPGSGSVVNITADSITGNWQTYNIATPKYFTKDNVNVTPQNYWMLDSSGQCWSDIAVTTGSSYWIYMGNYAGAGAGNGGRTGNGLAYYQGSDGTGWIFVFRDSAIDYTNAASGSISWVYGWKPSDGSNANANGACGLKTPAGTNNSHETFVAPDNAVYFCDANYVDRFFQTSPGTPFDPTTPSTYTFDQTPLLPFTDTANCLGFLGTNIMVGGIKNVIYPWDTTSPTYSYPILIAESLISKMLTVNTNTFILAGNRGRVYITNGSQAQLYKKIPDHISGTVEPYFTWGGIGSTKNQLYFSALATTNALTTTNNYGGLWAIDMDTKAMRLANKLSYGTYAGYVTAMIPIISPPNTNNPGGTGLYMGWSTGVMVGGASTRVVTNGVLNTTTTVVSATIAFTANDVGNTIAGTGIPVGSTIVSVTNSTTAIISQTATTTATGVTFTVSSGFGIDQTIGTPYTGGEAIVDSEYIPIGTYLEPTTNSTVEFKLSVALATNESVKLQWRQLFAGIDTFTDVSSTTTFSGSTANTYSGVYQNVNFQNSQWIQLRAVLTSTNTNPSYCRLTEFRLK